MLKDFNYAKYTDMQRKKDWQKYNKMLTKFTLCLGIACISNFLF